MRSCSSMLAMISSVPPQWMQRSISMPNTRLSRRAQLSGRLPRCSRAPMCRRHRRAQFAVCGKHAVQPCQMHPRRRHQYGQPRHQIQRFQHEMRGTVAVRGLELVAGVPG